MTRKTSEQKWDLSHPRARAEFQVSMASAAIYSVAQKKIRPWFGQHGYSYLTPETKQAVSDLIHAIHILDKTSKNALKEYKNET